MNLFNFSTSTLCLVFLSLVGKTNSKSSNYTYSNNFDLLNKVLKQLELSNKRLVDRIKIKLLLSFVKH